MNPYVLSLVSGILLALSWPTSGLFPLLFIAFVPLLWLIETTPSPSYSSIAKHGFLAFFIWNLSAAWWMCKYHFFGGLSVMLINAMAMSAVLTLYALFRRKGPSGVFKHLAFPALWLSFEWFHQHWDLSWPWLNLGNVFSSSPALVQWYEYTGVFGGSLWVLIVNGLTLALLSAAIQKRSVANIAGQSSLVLILIMAPIAFSLQLYANYTETENPIQIAVIQQNTHPQTEQTQAMNDSILNRIIPLINGAANSTTSLVICPENAIQTELSEERIHTDPSVQKLQEIVAQHPKLSIIIGATTRQSAELSAKGAALKYNSALVIQPERSIQFYHKSKLVPGVEKLPFASISRPILELLKDGEALHKFSQGEEAKTFSAVDQQAKVGILICYESAYGAWASAFVNQGASVLAIISNDAWWQDTDGHRQHLALARLRAIETRRSIARAANTGISAFINQRGEIVAQTQWNNRQSLSESLNSNHQMTFYVIFGDYILTIANLTTLAMSILMIFNMMYKSKRSNYFFDRPIFTWKRKIT